MNDHLSSQYVRQLIKRSKYIDKLYKPDDAVHIENLKNVRALKLYPSGSSYQGEWLDDHWDGQGVYTFPHGVVYSGGFSVSEFHGEGILKYPNGELMKTEWANGELIKWEYFFEDGLSYSDPWEYCLFPQRTFNSTRLEGHFKQPDKERLTNRRPTRDIPDGSYDVEDGFYNPKHSCINNAKGHGVVRIPTSEETEWILKHCRTSKQGPVGYKPDLYEFWSSGTRQSVKNILDVLKENDWDSNKDEASSHSTE